MRVLMALSRFVETPDELVIDLTPESTFRWNINSGNKNGLFSRHRDVQATNDVGASRIMAPPIDSL